MKSLRVLAAALFHRARMERDMAEELALHMEYRTADLERAGCTHAEAARRARLEFGAVEGYKERCREVRGLAWFDELRGNLRYTVRIVPGNLGVWRAESGHPRPNSLARPQIIASGAPAGRGGLKPAG